MKTVAIISEYNPFHNGHLYQVNEIRRIFGDDTAIIAIMSGNFTQRGELAIADKTRRAKWAVMCGVNLVLELPFPFSISSAEFFATSAIHIINSLSTVDYLCFGSESGDIGLLHNTAACMLTAEYESKLSELSDNKSHANCGYPELCEMALTSILGEGGYVPLTPNNILALEYVKALLRTGSTVKPYTIKREGDYNSEEPTSDTFSSATSARKMILSGSSDIVKYLPEATLTGLREAITEGLAPIEEYRLSTAVLSHFRLNSRPDNDGIHDAGGGLYNRLMAKSLESNNLEALALKTETRRYTTARIKRAIWYSFFGVTSSDVRELPMYTQLLATDQTGRRELKRIKKHSDFPILTKPSRTSELSEAAKRQKLKSDVADSVFYLAMPTPPESNISLTFTPYVKDDE